jgi:hypothetical protein
MVIDLFGLRVDEVQTSFPEVYQWILERVKPERDHNNRPTYKNNWWIFGEPRAEFRPALRRLSRYISTVETSKHRFFVFLDKSILPDNRLINFAFDDAYFLGVLSSLIHVTFALAGGGTLEDRPVYNKTRCFDPFPFPDCTEQQKVRIRELGEALDAHRKRQQQLHPDLTLTDMYNILEKIRAGQLLDEKDRSIHDDGLISILQQIHNELDSAVLAAYGWPSTLTKEELLARLVHLNAERAEEERLGLIRWLRPEYQKPAEGVAVAFGKQYGAAASATKPVKLAWPKTIPEQASAVRQVLIQSGAVTPRQLAKNFSRANVDRVEELLQTLVSLGKARKTDTGQYVP